MLELFDRVLLLKNAPIFAEVGVDDLRFVAQAMEEEHYHRGERIFHRGEQGDHMYIVIDGRIGISLTSDCTEQQYVAIMQRGDCFGEMNLLDEMPRSANACVLDDSRVLTLEKTRMRGLIMSYPELALGMLRGFSLRLRQTNEKQLAASEPARNKP